MATRSKIEIANSLRQLANELDGAAGIVDAPSYPPVFDVQPLGYTKIGAVEEFRDELNASLDPLAKRYVATLPHWWFVQDAEEYVDLTEEQTSLQEFNCGNARFTSAIMGSSAEAGDSMWRTFRPAVVRTYNEDTMSFEDTPIIHPDDGKPVYAVPNDSRAGQSVNSRVLKKNPRVADMAKVVRASYDFFYARNRNAILPLEGAYGGAFGNKK